MALALTRKACSLYWVVYRVIFWAHGVQRAGLRVRVWQVRQGLGCLMECAGFTLVVGNTTFLLRVTLKLGNDSVD